MSEHPDISVIIASYNESAQLQWTLENVIHNLEDAGEHSVEVVVVDDCSPDDDATLARETVRGLSTSIPVAVERNDRRLGVAGARNAGGDLAKGRCFIWIDAHSAPLSHNLFRRVAAPILDENTATVIAGPLSVAVPHASQSDIRLGRRRRLTIDDFDVKLLEDAPIGQGVILSTLALDPLWAHQKLANRPFRAMAVRGGCFAVLRDWFAAEGRFDDGLAWPWGYEDVELCLRAWRLGYDVRVVPDALMGFVYREAFPYGGVNSTSHLYNRLRVAVKYFDAELLARVLEANKDKPMFSEVLVDLMLSNAIDERQRLEECSPHELSGLRHVWEEFGLLE